MSESYDPVLRRVAIIGDVHAEDRLLQTCLQWVSSHERVDAIACTGDIVDGHGSVARCCALLRDYHVVCVRGNHDRWVFTGVLRDSAGATRLEDLDAADQEFLKELPPTRDLRIPGGLMLLCHGIGSFDLEKITDYQTDYSLKANRCLQSVVTTGKYRLMVNGHSHARLVRTVDALVVVNAGTLCHADDPGFVLLDFERNLLQWHIVRGGMVAIGEKRSIFSDR